MLSAKFNGYNVHLVEKPEEIEMLKEKLSEKVYVGIDTETEGLDFYKHDMVGLCVSLGKSYSVEDYAGYYIPIKHSSGNNIDVKIVADFAQYLLDGYSSIFFNRPFDFFFLEKIGVVCPFVGKSHDAQVMAHLSSGESFPSLKDFSRNYLKWNMIDFADNKSKDHNFGTTNPEVSFVYAAGDPLATVFLARNLWSRYPYIRKIYPLDNKASEAVRRLSKETLLLDKNQIAKELEENERKLYEIQEEIYALAGCRFKIDSNRDKADILSRFVTLTKKTSKGNFQVNEEALMNIDHPLAGLLIKYAHLKKYISSYLAKMINFGDDVPFKVNYSSVNVVTGRLSSGAAKDNTYFSNFNIQNVPKVEKMRFIHRDVELGYIVNDSKFAEVSSLTDCPNKVEIDKIKKTYKLKFAGKELILPEGTLLRVKRNDLIQFIEVQNLTPEDYILSETDV